MEIKVENKEVKVNNIGATKNNDLQIKTIIIDMGNTQIKVTDGVREEVNPDEAALKSLTNMWQ